MVPTAEQDNIPLAPNCGFYITVICSSVLNAAKVFTHITDLLRRFILKPQTHLVIPDETWQSHSHVLCIPPSLLPAPLFPAPFINAYSKVLRKENICPLSAQNSSVCAFEHLTITQGLSSSQQKPSGERHRDFLLPNDTMNYFLKCLGSALH